MKTVGVVLADSGATSSSKQEKPEWSGPRAMAIVAMRHAVKAALLVIVVVTSVPAAAQGSKPRLAIFELSNASKYPDAPIGRALTTRLETAIQKGGKYELLDRQSLDLLEKEIKLGESDLTRKSTVVKRGGVRGAEFYVTGRITDVEYIETAQQYQVETLQGLRTEIRFQQTATVTVNVQVKSTETSTIVESIDANGRETTQSAVSLSAYWNQFVRGDSNVMSQIDLLNRAANAAVQQVALKVNAASRRVGAAASAASADASVEQMADARGKVLAEVSTEEVIVGLGSENGLQRGDRVLIGAETITRNKQGAVVYRGEQPLGAAEVVEQPQGSSARVRIVTRAEGATRPPKEGDVVKIDIEAARALRTRGTAASATATPSGSPDSASSSMVRSKMREANRYFEDGTYSAAIELYSEVLGIEPTNAEAIRRIFDGRIRNRDFLEAEEFAERVVESGQPIGLEVVHVHTMGRCLSTLSIAQGRLVFEGPKTDHPFNVARSDLVTFNNGKIGKTSFAGFVVRYRAADGEEKKLEMFPIVYAKATRGPFPGISVYGGEPADYEATASLTKLYARLVERFVR